VTPVKVMYEIELEPGEKLELPESLVGSIGPGRWLISVEQVTPQRPAPLRDHSAFLNSYVPEDEGLYDASPAG
jgi:hypothetical protein